MLYSRKTRTTSLNYFLIFSTFCQLLSLIRAKNAFVAEILHIPGELYFFFQVYRCTDHLQQPKKYIKYTRDMFFTCLCVFVCRRINKPQLNHHPSMSSFCRWKQQLKLSTIKSYPILHSLFRGKENSKGVWSVPPTYGVFDGIFLFFFFNLNDNLHPPLPSKSTLVGVREPSITSLQVFFMLWWVTIPLTNIYSALIISQTWV